MKNLAIAYAMKKKAKKMAMDDSHDPSMPSADESAAAHLHGDMVDRIMNKRKMMAEGGVVADEPGEQADEMSDDFDYLSTSDLDDGTTNSGAADGDEHGNTTEDDERKDIVSKIMRQRSMKQRNPNPA